MNPRIIQLVEELHREVNTVETQCCDSDSLRAENDHLKQQLSYSKATIHELESKLAHLEQENVLLKTHKRKLKLVVIKLKRRFQSKSNEKRNLNKMKGKLMESEIISDKIDVICLNDENSIENHSENDLDESPLKNEISPTNSSPERTAIPYPDASDRIKLILEKKSTLNPRKKQDRAKMDTKPCEQCSKWYGDSLQHMKDTCKHRYHVVPPSTPENFWNVRFPPSQND